MPTKTPTTAGRLTAKQRACPHPPANVHATYDERWETCDLCHIIRSRPLPAPWIVAWDESQPTDEPPTLSAEPVTVPVPTKRPRVTLRESSEPRTFAELRAIMRRDRDLLGNPVPWRLRSPALDDVYTPDQIATCYRCRGAGTIQDRAELHPSIATWPTVRHMPNPAQPARPCPRCQGAGRIPKYRTA